MYIFYILDTPKVFLNLTNNDIVCDETITTVSSPNIELVNTKLITTPMDNCRSLNLTMTANCTQKSIDVDYFEQPIMWSLPPLKRKTVHENDENTSSFNPVGSSKKNRLMYYGITETPLRQPLLNHNKSNVMLVSPKKSEMKFKLIRCRRNDAQFLSLNMNKLRNHDILLQCELPIFWKVVFFKIELF